MTKATANATTGTCNALPSNCIEGTSGTKCTKCATGYALKEDGTGCNLCDTNCEFCDTNGATGAGLCDLCEIGYYLTDAFECAACDDTDAYLCDSEGVTLVCPEGYFKSGTACTACVANCLLCDNASTCDLMMCAEGYQVKADNSGC